jgi:hypothetical protein
MPTKNIIFFLSFVFFLITGCTKLETTSLGGDLVPGSDRLVTDTMILPLSTTSFIDADSTLIGKTDQHLLGFINDPLFGTTTAAVYFSPLPSKYPLYPKVKDSLVFDSVVLSLSFSGSYGDTNAISRVNVYKVADNNFNPFVNYNVNQGPTINPGSLLGSKSFASKDLRKPMPLAYKKDTVTNQLRIRLSDAFGIDLLNRTIDTVTFPLNPDSIFRSFLNGIAIVPDSVSSGNAVNYFALTDAVTAINLYYRVKKPTAGEFDTTLSKFIVSNIPGNGSPGSARLSANANKIYRNYTGSIAEPFLNSPAPANLAFIETAPGTAVKIKIPNLDTLVGKQYIIHRAEIVARQIYSGPPLLEAILVQPDLHLFTYQSNGTVSAIPFDSLNYFFPRGNSDPFGRNIGFYQIETRYTGGEPSFFTNTSNNVVAEYRMNVTRFVQNIINGKTARRDFKLSAPYFGLYNGDTQSSVSEFNPLAYGRVQLGGGTHPQYPMHLRIYYSKQ